MVKRMVTIQHPSGQARLKNKVTREIRQVYGGPCVQCWRLTSRKAHHKPGLELKKLGV